MGVRICLGQLKTYACGYLARVSAGETLEVVRRGRLAAFMMPPSDGAAVDRVPDTYVPLSHLRKNAAPYFDRAAAGEIIGVLRRGRLVARIVAAASNL
jgi:antitoxin (DNA-binding transcriptional repressor) of toxin-antitoxin stability system